MRFVSAAILVLVACSSGGPRLIVAAGTTLVDNGLIDALAAEYEADHPGVEVSVVGDATAQVLALARNGAVDVTITHAPVLEAAFEADGLAASARTAFASRFILAGPPLLAISLDGLDIESALDRIAEEGYLFVSRADGSGTHLVEQAIWARIGRDPTGEAWYLETGQGMGLTLQVASERGAFTLAELGTFLTAERSLSLIDVGLSGVGLDNPYRAMAVRGSPVEGDAVRFIEWLVSPDGQADLVQISERLFGMAVFQPASVALSGNG